MALPLWRGRIRNVFGESDLIYPQCQKMGSLSFRRNTAADLGEELVYMLMRFPVDSMGSEDGQGDGVPRYRSVPSFTSQQKLFIRQVNTTEGSVHTISTKRFVLVSNVFGTLFAFFLVGQRIERFLHTQGISVDFVSFDFETDYLLNV
jgi:hypothetical protein